MSSSTPSVLAVEQGEPQISEGFSLSELEEAFVRCQASPETVGRFGEAWTTLPPTPTPDPATTERFYRDLDRYLDALVKSHPYLGRRYLVSASKIQIPPVPFWDFTGGTLLQFAVYLKARQTRESLWQQLENSAAALETLYHQFDEVVSRLQQHALKLTDFLEKSQQYLVARPQWGTETLTAEALSLRDRMLRRLGALQSLVLVLQQQNKQAELVRHQVIQHLDLFYQVRDVLRPVARQHEDSFQSLPKAKRRQAWKQFQKSVGGLLSSAPDFLRRSEKA